MWVARMKEWLIPIAVAVLLVAVCVSARAVTFYPGEVNCRVAIGFAAAVGDTIADRTARQAGASEDRIQANRLCLIQA